jgi:hypothetical protein
MLSVVGRNWLSQLGISKEEGLSGGCVGSSGSGLAAVMLALLLTPVTNSKPVPKVATAPEVPPSRAWLKLKKLMACAAQVATGPAQKGGMGRRGQKNRQNSVRGLYSTCIFRDMRGALLTAQQLEPAACLPNLLPAKRSVVIFAASQSARPL